MYACMVNGLYTAHISAQALWYVVPVCSQIVAERTQSSHGEVEHDHRRCDVPPPWPLVAGLRKL